MNEKKKFMRVAIAAMAVFACVGFAGCMDDVYNGGGNEKSEEPNSFDFSTKKAVEFTLKYDVPAKYRVYFEVYTKSPLTLDDYKSYVKDSTLTPFFLGRCDENGSTTFKGDLPASVTEIYAYSPAIGVPVLMKATVSDAGVVSSFEIAKIPTASSTRAGSNPSGTSKWTTYSVTLNRPELEAVSREITQQDKNLIDKSFSENQNYDLVTTYYQRSIELVGKAEVKIYSVSNGGKSDRTNALAYFVYTKTNEEVKPVDVNGNINLIFSELNKNTPKEGAGYQLLNGGEKVFEPGMRIGFALFPDITPNNINTKDANVMYSCYNIGSWNAYTYPSVGNGALNRASVPHMVMSVLKRDENTGHAIIAIGFEDQPWSTRYGTNRGDFRDDIFIIEVTPASSLPGGLPEPPKEDPDYDTETNSSGILCFEDCWPAKGDYDMNDVVVSYKRTLCENRYLQSGPIGLVALKETYTFLNNGATYMNGFGYQLLGLTKTDIQKCTVTSDYVCDGQGLDGTLNDATVMLFDNGTAIKKKATFTVYTSFSGNGQKYAHAVNPFIVVRDGQFSTTSDKGLLSEGRVEVHLPTSTSNAMVKYLPTSKANTTYWGAHDDLSKVDQNIYYVRQGSYPFALDLSWDESKYGDVNSFVVPAEKATIEHTYSGFTKWVESNKKENTDWYYHPYNK